MQAIQLFRAVQFPDHVVVRQCFAVYVQAMLLNVLREEFPCQVSSLLGCLLQVHHLESGHIAPDDLRRSAFDASASAEPILAFRRDLDLLVRFRESRVGGRSHTS